MNFRLKLGFLSAFFMVLLGAESLGHADPRRPSEESFSLRLEAGFRQSLPADQVKALEEFVQSVEQELPAQMKAVIRHAVEVDFQKLGGASLTAPSCAADQELTNRDAVYAVTRLETRVRPGAHRITLHSDFISDLLAGPRRARAYPCGHRGFYRLAQAKLVHELTHVYDRLPGVPGYGTISWVERNRQEFCAEQGNGYPTSQKDNQCYSTVARGGSLSGQGGFQFLSGWGAKLSQIQPRSPDSQEYLGPRESLAVQMEYFLLDPEFGCRRPTVFSYLSSHFQHTPRLTSKCLMNSRIGINGIRADEFTLVNLDPARVYEIHYLLADSGKDVSSRWGHSMFRIVLCSPQRGTVGPECLQDVDQHVVVSYRANVTGLSIDNMAGLTGKYPSQLFFLRFMNVVAEYTRGELRDVLSLPLRLDRVHLERFVQRALEQYWQYQDKYYFVSKNCATESLGFLKGVMTDHPIALRSDGIVTPKDVLDIFRSEGLLDVSHQDDPAGRGRYFFQSISRGGQESFDALIQAGALPSAMTIDAYLDGTSASERLSFFERVVISSRSRDAVSALAVHFYSLESLAREHAKQELMNRAMKWLEQNGGANSPILDPYRPQIMRVQELQASLLPWNFARGGYGIPLSSEVMPPAEVNAVLKEVAQIFTELTKALQAPFESELREIEATQKNQARFLKEISKGSQ